MKWNKYTIKTTTDAVDLISSTLMEVGIDGIEIQDNVPLSEEDRKRMFIDILPILPPDEGIAYVSFYLDPDSNVEETVRNVKDELEVLRSFADIGEGTILNDVTEDKDWINNWKQYFKPFSVDDILIKPTWEQIKEADQGKMIIEIDPGTAFGTGMHETTQLCIRQLKKYVRQNTRILDVGCGSGILSIVGLKLGAKEAVATDIDPIAVDVTYENALVNKISTDTLTVYAGNIIEDDRLQQKVGFDGYDIVVANILADIIIPLSKEIPVHLKQGGVFISSGIINTKEQAVVHAIEENPLLEIIEITRQNDWVSVTARRV